MKTPKNLKIWADFSANGWIGAEGKHRNPTSLIITFQNSVRKTAYKAGFINGYKQAMKHNK